MQADSSGTIYGRCICCLTKGKHRPGGDSIEMLQRCLSLIVFSESQTPPMCSSCISFVRKVQKFRDMVVASQRTLQEAVTGKDNDTAIFNESADDTSHYDVEMIQQVKIKVENCDNTLNSLFVWQENVTEDIVADDQADVKDENEGTNSMEYIKREDINVKMEKGSIKNSKDKRKRSIVNGRSQPKKKRKKSDSESDTPISQIKKKKALLKEKKEPKPTLSPTKLGQLRSIIRENNKIRSNILLLLKHSTIVPFLNNFKSPFKCFYCDIRYIPFKDLKEHTEKHHVDICETKVRKVLRKLPEYIVTADISCLQCKLCEEEFKTIDNLTEHLSKVHEKVYHNTDKKPSHGIIGFDLSKDVLKCHICEKEFPYFKNLLVHMNEHGSFICYICGKKFFSERKYRSHVTKHEKTGATACKQCGKTFVSKSAMAFHNRKEHIKSLIKCLKCPETFPFEHYAQRLDHMEIAHGIKRPIFRCESCGREFKTSGILSNHINLTHKRNKEFKCDICNYATFNSSHYKNHRNTHFGVKKYECQLCKKKFLKMYSLTRHLMMHTNDKRFSCPLCDAAFIQKVNMKSHMMHRHKDFDLRKL